MRRRYWSWAAPQLMMCAYICLPSSVDQAQQNEYFAKIVAAAYQRKHGCLDHAAVVFGFKASYERNLRKGLIVDVGAHLGADTIAMINLFGAEMLGSEPVSRLLQKGELYCEDQMEPVAIYVFEANPETFVRLEERLTPYRNTPRVRLSLIHAAVSKAPGNATLFHTGPADEKSSLSERFVHSWSGDPVQRAAVHVVSLDTFFPSDASIHFLKIDTEGFDATVLKGARRLLLRKQVKFFVFEYGLPHWSLAGHGLPLEMIIQFLDQMRYMCFLITWEALVPISDQWFRKSYNAFELVNIFCGQAGDPDLFEAYVAFGTNQYTLAYALENLMAPAEMRAVNFGKK